MKNPLNLFNPFVYLTESVLNSAGSSTEKSKLNNVKKNLLIFLLLQSAFLITFAQNLPEPSNPPRLVNDFAHFLSEDEVAALENKLLTYDDSTSNEIAIVTVESLDDYEASEYANKLFEKWGIGNKEKDNGILILLSKEEHAIWIEVGYGLEGRIPDMIAKRIIDEVMIPNFKAGDFYQGIDGAVNALISGAAGEYKGDGKSRRKKDGGPGWIVFVIILIIIFIINKLQGPKQNTYSRRGVRGGSFLGGAFLGGGFGGGGGGGGGFGGFGGGGSGGGGAGGSW